MTKHIHVHLPPGVTISQVRTGDSDWDESKHKRDDGGKFSSGGGGGASKPAAPSAPTEPVKVKETENHPFVEKLIRTHPSQAAMKQAIAKNDTATLTKGLAALKAHPHQGASQKMVKELFEAELKSRGAGAHPSVTAPSSRADQVLPAKMPELKVRGLTATAEAGSDGTYRAKLLNEDGSIHRLTATSFKTPQEAAEHAEQLALGNKPATTAKQEPSAPAGGDPDIEYNGKKYKAHSGKVMQMTHAQYERIQPGKVYMFDGRKALVTGKRLPTDKNAAGIVSGLPTMTVLWFKKKE